MEALCKQILSQTGGEEKAKCKLQQQSREREEVVHSAGVDQLTACEALLAWAVGLQPPGRELNLIPAVPVTGKLRYTG